MATGFRKILEGLRLIPKAASTASEKGDLDVTTSSGKLNYHDGTTASPIVTEDHSATLTNKTLDSAVVNNYLDLNNTSLINAPIITNNGYLNIETLDDSFGGISIITGDITSGPGNTGNISLITGITSGSGNRGDIWIDTRELALSADGIVSFVANEIIFSPVSNRIKVGDPVSSDAVSIIFDPTVFPNQVEFRNELNALLPLQIASPTLSDQAATKSYVDAVNIVSVTAGENITTGSAVYISTGTGSDSGRTAGRVYKLDAKNDDRVEFFGFANTTALSGAAVLIQVSGKRSGLTGLSVGKPVFASVAVSGNEGAVQTTAPTAANQWVIPVGIAINTTELVVNGAGSATAVKITSEVVDNLYADVINPIISTTLTNANSVVLATGGAGGITITLPPPATGKIFNIKKIDSSPGFITVSAPSGTIDGTVSKTIASQYDSLTITSNGTNFFLI